VVTYQKFNLWQQYKSQLLYEFWAVLREAFLCHSLIFYLRDEESIFLFVLYFFYLEIEEITPGTNKLFILSVLKFYEEVNLKKVQ